MLLTREQVARLAYELDGMDAAREVLIGGEGGNVLVSILDESGEPFYRFELNPDGEISEERKL